MSFDDGNFRYLKLRVRECNSNISKGKRCGNLKVLQ